MKAWDITWVNLAKMERSVTGSSTLPDQRILKVSVSLSKKKKKKWTTLNLCKPCAIYLILLVARLRWGMRSDRVQSCDWLNSIGTRQCQGKLRETSAVCASAFNVSHTKLWFASWWQSVGQRWLVSSSSFIATACVWCAGRGGANSDSTYMTRRHLLL